MSVIQNSEAIRSVSFSTDASQELVVRVPPGTALRVERHDSNRVEIDLRPAFSQAAQPGNVMPDGTVFAGISPRSKKPLYVTPQDEPRTMDWQTARGSAWVLTAHGHGDWRIPHHEELNVIFRNSAAIGGFSTMQSLKPSFSRALKSLLGDSVPNGWYWSSSEEDSIYARSQRFTDGCQGLSNKLYAQSVRYVRG